MEEQVFMNDGSVSITSSRVVIDGQTFATRNIGSVSVKDRDIGIAPLFLAAVGIACGANGYAIWAFLWIAAATYLIWQRVSEKTLVIVAGGGETVAMKTNDSARAMKVHDAVIQAISVR